jgi:hypothetical protein
VKTKSLFAVILAITFACDDGNEDSSPKETSLLTLTVDASYPVDAAFNGADDTDDWIIVHSEDGTLLASENFQNNQELEIKTDKPAEGKITITHVRYVALKDGNKSYSVKSYTNIEKGEHMVLKGTSPLPGKTGKINVSVSNVFAYQNCLLTSRVGTSSNSSSWNGGTGMLDIQEDTYSGVTKYIATVSNGNVLKYKVLDNVQPNGKYSFSFNDMTSFEQKVTFTFPQSSIINVFVYGGDPDPTLTSNAYLLDRRFISNSSTAIVTNYTNSLTNYKTELLIYYNGYQYTYLNQGSIPDGNVTWPQKSDFNVTEKSFSNFSATTLKSYVWRNSLWNYQDAANKITLFWAVTAPLGNQKINELPAEIINVHPALSLNNLKYYGTIFYTQSPAYELFFDNALQAAPEPTGLRLGIFINAQ